MRKASQRERGSGEWGRGGWQQGESCNCDCWNALLTLAAEYSKHTHAPVQGISIDFFFFASVPVKSFKSILFCQALLPLGLQLLTPHIPFPGTPGAVPQTPCAGRWGRGCRTSTTVTCQRWPSHGRSWISIPAFVGLLVPLGLCHVSRGRVEGDERARGRERAQHSLLLYAGPSGPPTRQTSKRREKPSLSQGTTQHSPCNFCRDTL